MYQAALETLAEDLKVEVVYQPSHLRGRASHRERRVLVPWPETRWSFLVGLHELGHVVLRDREVDLRRLQREAWCWNYALSTSGLPWDYRDRQRIAANLLRYLVTAPENRRAIPPVGDPFWNLLTWWEPYAT